MPRRALWLFLAGFVIAVVGAVALVFVFRTALLDFALETYVAHEGFPEARLDVTEFGLERIVITDVSLGESGPSAARVVIGSYLNLLRNTDRFRLTIESPRMTVDLTQTGGAGSGASLAQAESFLENYRDLLPILDLRDAVVTVRGTQGRAVTLAADVITRVDWPSFGFAAEGTVTGEGADITFNFRSGGSAKLPGMRLDAQGTADLAALPWPAGTPAPSSGTASFRVESLLPLPTLTESFDDAFGRFDGNGKLDLTLANVSLPDRVKDLSAHLAIEGEGSPHKATLRLSDPADVKAAGLDVPELADLGAAGAALAARLAGGMTAAVLPDEAGDPLLVLARDKDGWRGSLAARLTAAAGDATAALLAHADVLADSALRPQELAFASVEVEGGGIPLGFAVLKSVSWKGTVAPLGGKYRMSGPLDLRLAKLTALDGAELAYSGAVTATGDAEEQTIEAPEPGHVTLDGKAFRFGALEVDGPLQVGLSKAQLRRDSGGIAVELAGTPGEVSGAIERDAGPIPFKAQLGTLGLDARIAENISGTLGVEKAAFDLPDMHISVTQAAAQIPFAIGAGAKPARLTATIRSTADPALFDPVAADFDVTQEKDALAASGKLSLAEGRTEVPVTARYEFASGKGDARLGPAQAVFAAGRLQPAALFPAGTRIRRAEGTVRYEGDFAYAPDGGLKSRGQIEFDGVDLEMLAARIENLRGTVRFTDLLDLQTAPDQILTADKVSAGAAIDAVTLDFSMAAAPGGAVMDIDEAHAHLAGGDLDVPRTALRFADATNAVTIQVKSVSLAQLLKQLGTDSVGGTGLFSGSIPLRFGTTGFSVEDAKLTAESGGLLQVRLGTAKETLEAQGEAMRLMVRALENFHYKVFEIGISRPPGADLSLKIKLEGMNPEVLDGHPFRFNINLSGNVGPLWQALKAGQGLTADILERAVDVER